LKAAATSILRTIIGAVTGNPMMALPSSTGQFGVGPTGYANGGEPQAHRAALVGERGPELFIPKTAGTIVPNSAIGSLGGTQVINNYNIQAIDVKSFEDRIMGSNKAVWAANSYANKSLAVGRGRA
jgi:SLT domain-containing protein